MYMYGGPLENVQQLFLGYLFGTLIHAYLFGSREEDKESDYDHTLIDDLSVQDGEKEIQTCARMLS